MGPDRIKTILDLSKDSVDCVNAFWSIYSGVAFALIGYAFAAKRPVEFLAVRIILVIVFGIFAVSNGHALIREQRKAIAVSDYVAHELRNPPDQSPEVQQLANTFQNNKPAAAWQVTALHVSLDVAVVLVVFLAPTIQRRKASKDRE